MTVNDAPKPRITRRRDRPWLWAWAAIASVMLALGGLWILFQISIAGIVENRILAYADRLGIESIRLDLRRITPWQADLHAFRVGRPATGGQLGFDSLILDYSPAGLKAQVIDRVQLSGLNLELASNASGWRLAGLPSRRTAPRAAPGQTPTDWRINHLVIRNSRLAIRHRHQQIVVPFELQMHAGDQTDTRFRGQLNGQLWAQPFAATFQWNGPQQQLIVDGLSASIDLQHLNQVLDASEALPFSGRLMLAGQARLTMAPLAIDAAEVKIRLPDKIMLGKRLNLQALNRDLPLAEVRLVAERTWTLQAPGFDVTSMPNLRVRDLTGRFKAVDGGWRLDGALNLGFHPPADDTAAMAAANRGPGLPLTYQGQWQEGGPWSLALAGEAIGWELGWNQDQTVGLDRLSFKPLLRLKAKGQKDHVEIAADARLTEFRGLFDQTTIRIPDLSIHVFGEGPWNQLQGRCALKADNLRVNAAQLKGHLPRLAVESDFKTVNGGFQVSGETRLARGVLRLPERNMRLEGLRFKIPFTWPHDPSTVDGRFHLAAATWNDLGLGEVRGRIRQQADGADFRLTNQSPMLPGGKLQVDGRLTLGAESASPLLAVGYRFERPESPEEVDLGRLMTDLAGIRFNGRIDAEGRGTYQAGQIQAGLKIQLSNGRLMQPAQKRGLVGLQGRIDFPNLPVMRTAPGQQVVFERAYSGDIVATDGRFDFQVEPGGVFFLEQGRFKWCDGTIYLPATRLVPQNKEYALTLWCDRLKLAPLLEQLGAARAEGGGTVSGRIPIGFRQDRLLIDSGFLFSSPGEGGTIRLRGTEMLTAGIPPGTPQYNQLELARRALEEYDYDWVKLGLETAGQEDLLRLKLQLSGRPSKPLAFIYDSRTGGFVPAGPDSPGSRFQEIRLDVNFSLPLNRLLEYKDLLKLFS